MGYILDSKNISINNKAFLSKEHNIYQYNGMALKVYPKGKLPEGAMNEKVAKYFTTITTERILLPKSVLYFNDKFAGYSFNIPSRKNVNGRIITSESKDFINNILVLERDVEELNKKKVLLSNLDPKQVFYNGEIYLMDPSGYIIFEQDYFSLDITNNQQLHLLLTEIIGNELKKDGFSKAVIEEVLSLFRTKDEEQSSSYFFKNTLEGDSVKKFVKKNWE